jgi:hypothetical protein
VIGRVRRRLAAFDGRFDRVDAQTGVAVQGVAAVSAAVERLEGAVAELSASCARTEQALARLEHDGAGRIDALAAAVARLEAALARTVEAGERNGDALRWLAQDQSASRAQLLQARAHPSYTAAFDDPEPLVSVVIPTYDHLEELLERSLPSVLGQTYERLDVVVVGDAVAPEVGAAVDALGDARVRFVNRPHRVPYADPHARWLVGSVAARNAGHELARGAWLVDFDDDDRLRPRAVELGLALARERRVEVAYGRFVYHWPDGRDETMGSCPPEQGRFATQGALVHAGLRFFERSAAAAAFGVPNDWFRIEAMLRAGVTFAMHDDVVFDYHPSTRGPAALRTQGST